MGSPTVVIDPGHGRGRPPLPHGRVHPDGVVGALGTLERTLTLDMAQRLERHLSRCLGVNVLLTRTSDVYVDVPARVALSRHHRADVFVSLHFDGRRAGSPPLRGPMTNESRTFLYAKARPHAAPIVASASSARLAGHVDRELRAATGLRGRPGVPSILRRPLGVLHPASHDARTAACLVEISNLSDPGEESLLLDPVAGPRRKDGIAANLADAIYTYLAAAIGYHCVLPGGNALGDGTDLAFAGAALDAATDDTTASREAIDVWHEVPLVPQLTGMSCWAAAAAMIIGWRDSVPVEPEQVARGSGRWKAYRAGLLPRDLPALADAWGLRMEDAKIASVTELRQLLERNGPLWVGEASPGLHSIVVTGMAGDGTPDGTWVHIADPWPKGRGERYRVSFRELSRTFHAVQGLAGGRSQVLHAGGRGLGASRSFHAREEVRVRYGGPGPDASPA